MQVSSVRSHSYQANGGCLPHILVIYFGHSHVKLLRQAFEQRFDDLALVFDRVNAIELKFENTGGNQHEGYCALLSGEKQLPGITLGQSSIGYKDRSETMKETNVEPVENSRPQPGLLRRLMYIVLILFLIAGIAASSLVIFSVSAATRAAKTVTQPLSDLVKQLAEEATPVILPDPVTIVREINRLNQLETASYSLQKIVTAQRNQEVLWGALGESLIFVAVGDVIAGIDLSQLQVQDLQIVDPETVMVHLPDAQVLHYSLDNTQSYVADRDKGLFAQVDSQLETQVRQEAEKQILEEALAAGILQEANENARTNMESFLNKLGFDNVVFTEGPPPPAPPYEQDLPKGTILTTPTP